MAASGPRMGIEIEYHQITLSWKRADGRLFPAIADVDTHDRTIRRIPVQDQTIFIPVDTAEFGTETAVTWEGLWGFQIVPDGVAWGVNDELDPTVPGGSRKWQYGNCILELNTSAGEIRNYEFWMQEHLCARKFLEAINSFPETTSDNGWTSLDQFVDKYNSLLDAIVLPTTIRNNYLGKFKIQYSQVMRDLIAGRDARWPGVQWVPQFRTGSRFSSSYKCDVQVNYQVELDVLDQNAALWIGLWDHMWVKRLSSFSIYTIDPDVTLQSSGSFMRTTPQSNVYRTQLYAAAWLTARARAGALLATHKHAALSMESPEARRIRALLTYILTAGAVTTLRTAQGNQKNCMPQLPKTSPAAIAQKIRSDEDTAMAAKVPPSDARPAAATLDALAADAVADAAQDIMTTDLRNMGTLMNMPGLLNAGSPVDSGEGYANYPDSKWADNILKGPPNINARLMWQAALRPPPADMTAATKQGYDKGPPFYVHWSDDVKTAIPPSAVGSPAGTPPRISFESRYGYNLLNIGFDPTVQPFMFAKSYLPMVSVFATSSHNDAIAAVKAMPDQLFGIRDDVVQDFSLGWH